MDPKIIAVMIASGLALIGTIGNIYYQVWRAKRSFLHDADGTKTGFMAETVARKLLEHEKLPYRSFRIIRHHIGGYTDEELRKILVRSGAIRTMSKSGEELWILVDRMIQETGKENAFFWKIKTDPKTPDQSELFSAVNTSNEDR